MVQVEVALADRPQSLVYITLPQLHMLNYDYESTVHQEISRPYQHQRVTMVTLPLCCY